jgi:hypothetical protein
VKNIVLYLTKCYKAEILAAIRLHYYYTISQLHIRVTTGAYSGNRRIIT